VLIGALGPLFIQVFESVLSGRARTEGFQLYNVRTAGDLVVISTALAAARFPDLVLMESHRLQRNILLAFLSITVLVSMIFAAGIQELGNGTPSITRNVYIYSLIALLVTLALGVRAQILRAQVEAEEDKEEKPHRYVPFPAFEPVSQPQEAESSAPLAMPAPQPSVWAGFVLGFIVGLALGGRMRE
jgi:hypothetical protein